jgi:hypothetical protein
MSASLRKWPNCRARKLQQIETPRASLAPSRTNWKDRQNPAAMHLPQLLDGLKNSLAILVF